MHNSDRESSRIPVRRTSFAKLSGPRLPAAALRSNGTMVKTLDPEVVLLDYPRGTSVLALYAPSARKHPELPVEGVILFEARCRTSETRLDQRAVLFRQEFHGGALVARARYVVNAQV